MNIMEKKIEILKFAITFTKLFSTEDIGHFTKKHSST